MLGRVACWTAPTAIGRSRGGAPGGRDPQLGPEPALDVAAAGSAAAPPRGAAVRGRGDLDRGRGDRAERRRRRLGPGAGRAPVVAGRAGGDGLPAALRRGLPSQVRAVRAGRVQRSTVAVADVWLPRGDGGAVRRPSRPGRSRSQVPTTTRA